LVART